MRSLGPALVCLPTYQERASLPMVLERLLSGPGDVEILVIDDNSPDGSGEIAQDFAARDTRVHVLQRPRREGLGQAYLDGFRWALNRDFSTIVQMDADLSHDPAEVPRLIAATDDADLVIGSRFVEGGASNRSSLAREAMTWSAGRYSRACLGLPVLDPTAGFRCIRREVLEVIQPWMVRSAGYCFQVEFLYLAWRAGFRIREIPIRFSDRVAGRSKMGLASLAEGLWRIPSLRTRPDAHRPAASTRPSWPSLAPRLLRHRLARAGGGEPPLPVSLTVSVLTDCNARCATCNVYERKMPMLGLGDYDRIFASLADAPPHWVTLTGGEPTLRSDLPEIVRSLVRHCPPRIITLPTNGIATNRVLEHVRQILEIHRGALVVNLSLDGIGQEHDAIRGVQGNWEQALATLSGLRDLRELHPNLTLGINTVLSRFNAANFESTVEELLALEPDSYVVELAQEREELWTQGSDLLPDSEEQARAVAWLEQRLRRWQSRRSGRLVRGLRSLYHSHLLDYLAQPREILPCLAGSASAHLMPDGQVWTCSVRGEILGNVQETGLDFKTVWASGHARAARQAIRDDHCHCTMANATYINLLAWAPSRPRLPVGLGRALLRGFLPTMPTPLGADRGAAPPPGGVV